MATVTKTATTATNNAATGQPLTAFAQALLDGPTTLRGRKLLRHVMDIIAADMPIRDSIDDTEASKAPAHWEQESWCFVPLLSPEIITIQNDGADEYDDDIRVVKPQDVATDCGTTACLAGHTVMLVGDLLQVESRGEYQQISDTIIRIEDKRQAFIQDRAAELLDLSEEQAEILFHPNNSLTKLVEITDGIINDREKNQS